MEEREKDLGNFGEIEYSYQCLKTWDLMDCCASFTV